MAEHEQSAAESSAFEQVDPKLTVFALANGMDLTKSEEHRRLEWFHDGLERGMRVEPAAGGTFRVTAMAWKRKREDEALTADLGQTVAVDALFALLDDGINATNAL